MMESLYRWEQTLRANGITVRRANHSEETVNEYGERLAWVVDLGGQRQARTAYRTKAEALAKAEEYLP
jgi:hypothetical protein